MCAIYCWACRDSGVLRTWGGEHRCHLCDDACAYCGAQHSTARHRYLCAPWQATAAGAALGEVGGDQVTGGDE